MSTHRSIRRALVTGASGFIGNGLVDLLLRQGVAVKALVRDQRSASRWSRAGATPVVGDVTEAHSVAPAVQDIDTVFHAAGLVGPAHLPLSAFRRVNRDGVANLIEACRGRVERFVHISTVAVHGHVTLGSLAREDDPCAPKDRYGISKWEGECLAAGAARDGVPLVVARPTWTYGPESRSMAKLFDWIAHKHFLFAGPASNTVQPLWLDDLLSGLIGCATLEGIEGEVYHFAGPEVLTVEDLCRTIAATVNVRIPDVRLPLPLLSIAAAGCERFFPVFGLTPPLDKHKVSFFTTNHAYSIEKARTSLGWVPQKRFADGAYEMLAWLRASRRVSTSLT